MARIVPTACLMSLVLVAPAFAQTSSPSQSNASALTNSGTMGVPPNHTVSKDDRDFLNKAAQDNEGEIRLCLLAEARAKNPAVKAFARLMVDDHTLLGMQGDRVMHELHVPIPTDLSEQDKQRLDKLQALHGAAFDTQFMSMQVADRRHDISEYAKTERSTGDENVRAMTQGTLPILHQHLALAEAVDHAIGGHDGQQAAGNPPQHKG